MGPSKWRPHRHESVPHGRARPAGSSTSRGGYSFVDWQGAPPAPYVVGLPVRLGDLVPYDGGVFPQRGAGAKMSLGRPLATREPFGLDSTNMARARESVSQSLARSCDGHVGP